jgi:uncharacterized integral membrane protein (TIGR00698 family)
MKLSSKPMARSATATTVRDWQTYVMSLLPGLLLTGGIAAVAVWLARSIGIDSLNPLLLAVLLGIGWRYLVGLPTLARPGVQFAMRRVLRLAVILLGLRLSLTEVIAVGPAVLVVVTTSTLSTFYLTSWFGGKLHIGRRLTQLIAAGTSICGASAVIATNAVVDGSEEEMTYAISTITCFGTLAMLIYPLIADLFGLTPTVFGLWSGASVHEVAQVIATSFQRGDFSGELATVTKLSRVLLIIPIMLILGWQKQRTASQLNVKNSFPMPWFVLFFSLLVIINSLGVVPKSFQTSVLSLNQVLLCMSLAAMGLETNLARLSQLGAKPMYLAGLSWVFLATTSLLMINLLSSAL